MGGKIDLIIVNFNLSGVYCFDSNWSFGLGFDVVYVKVKIECYVGDLGQIVVGFGVLLLVLVGQVVKILVDMQIVYFNGNVWGFGWNVGIFYELDKNNCYGLIYCFEVKIDFDGNYCSSLLVVYNQIFGNFGLLVGISGQMINGLLIFNLLEMWELFGYNCVVLQWVVYYSLIYISWSQFQELKVIGSNGQMLFYKEEGFKDVYCFVLGIIYYYDDNWIFCIGIVFDDSLVLVNNCFIFILDQDCLWLSVGIIYVFNKDVLVDVGVLYMYGQYVEIKEGLYIFCFEGIVWLYGVNFNYCF